MSSRKNERDEMYSKHILFLNGRREVLYVRRLRQDWPKNMSNKIPLILEEDHQGAPGMAVDFIKF